MSTIKSSSEHLTLNADGASKDIILQANGSTKVTVKSDGKVGIGTTPSRTLHVHSSQPYLHLTNTVTGSGELEGFSIYSKSADGSIHIRQREDTYVSFYTNSTERMRIQSGGGISFNGDTATANALDDYEEGYHTVSFTPSSGTITINTSFNKLAYTKVGRLVTVTGNLRVSSTNNPLGNVQITLPFTAGSLSQESDRTSANVIVYNNSGSPYFKSCNAMLNGGDSYINLLVGSNSQTDFQHVFDNGDEVNIHVVYYA